ncbi:MAG: hypothetical protein JW982_07010 [Spirochaetes bacterium]|nr:hypothetical protein [Spirochaetota bacterium]
MKKIVLLLILIISLSACASSSRVTSENQPQKNTQDYFDVIADRLSFHLSTYISQNKSDLIKDAIFYEMPYPRIYAILVFQPDGKFIDGFIKDNGKIKQLIYTVYFRDPTGMSIKVRKIFFNKKEIGVIKIFYR